MSLYNFLIKVARKLVRKFIPGLFIVYNSSQSINLKTR